MEASSSLDWPLDAPFAQGKTVSTLCFFASPDIPEKAARLLVPVTSQMHSLCYSHKLSCLLAGFPAVTSNCVLPVHLKLHSSSRSQHQSQEGMQLSVVSPP